MRFRRFAVAVAFAGTCVGAGCNAVLGIEAGTLGGKPAIEEGMVPIDVPAGAFVSEVDDVNRSATLTRSFAIDRHEVTVGRFRAWVDAGRPLPCGAGSCSLDASGPFALSMKWDPTWNDDALDTSTFAPTSNCGGPESYGPTTYNRGDDALPMTCVRWYQAAAFCAWEGKRLPTDSEWQYVASGHGDGRTYPFGELAGPLSCDQAIFLGTGDRCGFPVAVGSAPGDVSRDGVVDLTGSVFEWVWDVYDVFPDGATDYTGPVWNGTLETDRTRRGGSFICDASDWRLHAGSREHYAAVDYFNDAGFRCARSLPPP